MQKRPNYLLVHTGTFRKIDRSKIYAAINSKNWHSQHLEILNFQYYFSSSILLNLIQDWKKNLVIQLEICLDIKHCNHDSVTIDIFQENEVFSNTLVNFRANHASSMPCLQVDL